MGDNGKSLPDELVGDCNHGEFPGFSVAPKSGIGLLALCVEPAGWPRRHVKETSGVRISVAVDVTSDVYRASGLFVGRTDSEIPGYLFGILEVGEPSGSDDKCRGERYAYALDGCQQRELSAELGLDKAGKFRLEPVAPLSRNLIVSSTVWDAPLSGTGRQSREPPRLDRAVICLESWRMTVLFCRSRKTASP